MKTILFLCLVSAAPLAIFAQDPAAPAAPAAPSGTTEAVKSADWLLGAWVFDETYTIQKQGNSARDVSGTAETPATSPLIEKMRGATVTITRSELTMTRGDGNTRTEKYTIEPPITDTVVSLKQGSGEVITFHREGDRMWTSSNGSSGDLFFFKRAQ